MTEPTPQCLETVAKATLDSEDHTTRTLSALLLGAANQLRDSLRRQGEMAALIGKLSSELELRDRHTAAGRGITLSRRTEIL